MVFLLAVIARKSLGASKGETLVLTAAPTVLYILSIFWGTALKRTTIRRYLLVYFMIGCLPYALSAAVPELWWLIACHVVACAGGAAWPAVNGELLRRVYSDSQRGRAYGLLTAAYMLGGAGAMLGLGHWLDKDPMAWRIYMPVLCGMQAVGLIVLGWLATATGAERAGTERVASGTRADTSLIHQAFEPLTHMKEVLRADRVFARYEAAFMTYGIGWMICTALLPLLVTDKLNLQYDQIAGSTHLTFLLVVAAMTVPAGLMMDKLGAMRMSAVSFWFYTSYPILLMLATSTASLTAASVLYGIAAAGVNVCWMLGPVSLAGTAEKVPQYVAIHATLVGLRGAIFQALGVALYWLTGSFEAALLVAAGGFIWAGWQMWTLRKLKQG